MLIESFTKINNLKNKINDVSQANKQIPDRNKTEE